MSAETPIVRRTLDRHGAGSPIFLGMALLFLATAVVGFGPRSAAIVTGASPVPPLVVHVHAALMVTWLLLLVTQTSLVATGRLRLHRTLGVLSLGVAVALLLALISVAVVRYGQLTELGLGPFVSNILFLQIRSIVLFPTFYLWAIAARQTAPETHKRMMLLATLMLLDAAIARMGWLPGASTVSTYDGVHAYLLLLLVPALVYDLLRYGRVHRAYVIGLALLLPWIVVTHFLWNAPWWHATATALMGYGA